MPEALTIAIVTDIHNGVNRLTKMGARAPEFLRKFVAWTASSQPDLVVDLGDRISDTDPDTDRAAMAQVAAALADLDMPLRHIIGNHDLVHLSRSDNEAIMGQNFTSQSWDFKGWHLIFWQCNVHYTRHTPMAVTQADLDWLRHDLASTALPAVVFSHVPLDGQITTTNYYFEQNPAFARYSNTAEIQDVILQAGNVAACVAGHVHWNNMNRLGGVPFVTVQSLTESFTTNGAAAGVWGELRLDQDLLFRAHGADAMEVRVATGGGNQRWTAPLPRFSLLQSRQLDKSAGDIGNAKAFLLDLDGVIYRDVEMIPGADKFMAHLAQSGCHVLALTNNASKTAAEYSEKLARMGIDLPAGRILTSAAATVAFLQAAPKIRNIFVSAPASFKAALRQAGYTQDPALPVDAVIVAYDPAARISELAEAVSHVRAGARLIASNPDRTLPVGDGLTPETGAVIAFLETASGQVAEVVGKPEPFMYDLALNMLGLKRHEVVMVGDTLATDIAGARAAGLRAVLVESGNLTTADENDPEATIRVKSVADLIPLIGGS